MRKSRPSYFDYAAATPISEKAAAAVRKFSEREFGNAGSVHAPGQKASAAIDLARKLIAEDAGVSFRDVIFCGSATEANNLVIRGLVKKFREENPGVLPRIIISSVEHESIRATAEDLSARGEAEVTVIGCSRSGRVSPADISEALSSHAVLVSIISVNNETGARQPIDKIYERIRAFRKNQDCAYPIFHSDAAQAIQFFQPQELPADWLTISSPKIYGPKGAAALVGRDLKKYLRPIVTGGNQEFGLRAGTENVPAIAGFAAAFSEVRARRPAASKKIREQKLRLWRKIKSAAPSARTNGPDAESVHSAPHMLNVWLPGCPNQELLVVLDSLGCAVSAGPACSARALELSPTLSAMGLPEKRIRESIRISLGWPTTDEEIDRLARAIKTARDKLTRS